jgi:hypothetical protein
MTAEGWYIDPFGAHEARWFSDGAPTGLVRDGTDESHDGPPDASYDGELTPVETAASDFTDDQRRAGEIGKAYDPHDGVRAVWDQFDQRPRS